MIDVALLGCGGSMPIPNRYLTSLLLNYKGRKILIDCGEGTQVSMKLLGWGFKTIDVICITHFHADHIVGLPGLLSTIGNSGRIEPMSIIGPKGLKNIIDSFRVITPYLPYEIVIFENLANEYNFKIDNEQIRQINDNPDLIISTQELLHSSNCLGYKIHIKRMPVFDPIKATLNKVPKVFWNKLQKGVTINIDGEYYYPSMVLGENREGINISYITDTRPIKEIIDFVKKSDLFICEGMYGDDNDLFKAESNKHMIFREAAEIAARSNVGELILTHFSPAMNNPEIYIDNAKNIFNKTTIGYDRLVRELKFKEKN